jgi:hypothetical protein
VEGKYEIGGEPNMVAGYCTFRSLSRDEAYIIDLR